MSETFKSSKPSNKKNTDTNIITYEGMDIKDIPQRWVMWRFITDTKTGQYTKVPYQAKNHYKASSTNPKTWCNYDDLNHDDTFYDGIGFVFAEGDERIFIDLDHVLDPITLEFKPEAKWAKDLLDTLKPQYVEVSPSGDGLHIFMLGTLPKGHKNKKDMGGSTKLEVYTSNRFSTVTFEPFHESPLKLSQINQESKNTLMYILGVKNEDKLLQKAYKELDLPEIILKGIADKVEPIENDDMSNIDLAFFIDFIREMRQVLNDNDLIPTVEQIRTVLRHKNMYELRTTISSSNPKKYNRDDYIRSTIDKAVNELELGFDILSDDIPGHQTTSLDEFINMFSISSKELEVMEAKETNIIENILFKGQICVLVARPNAGKTLLAKSWSITIAQKGYQLIYIYEDADMKGYKDMATTGQRYGFNVIASFAKVGTSAKDILKALSDLAESGDELSDIVIVLDTLKKFTEVLDKKANKELFNTLRKVTAKGGTILILGHANKYPDDNGNLIYEGTGDIQADVDAMYMMYDDGNKHTNNNRRYITLEKEKSRAISAVNELSYELDLSTYTPQKLDEIIDTRKMMQQNNMYYSHKTEVEFVKDLIKRGITLQKDIVKELQESFPFGRDRAHQFLISLIGHTWDVKKVDRVGRHYYLLDDVPFDDLDI